MLYLILARVSSGEILALFIVLFKRMRTVLMSFCCCSLAYFSHISLLLWWWWRSSVSLFRCWRCLNISLSQSSKRHTFYVWVLWKFWHLQTKQTPCFWILTLWPFLRVLLSVCWFYVFVSFGLCSKYWVW